MRLHLLAKGLADFPVVAEGIDDAADAPAPLVGDGPDFFCAGGDGAGEGGVGIGDGEDDAGGAAGEGFGAEVVVAGGFVGQPEFCAFDGKAGDDVAAFAGDAKEFGRAESGLVEVYRG